MKSPVITDTASQRCSAAHLSTSHPTGRPAKLSPGGRDAAVNFILDHGTNLQRERYIYHFEDADNLGNVIAALGHYQNDDGGFAHGIEADLRSKYSSVIATTRALQMFDEIGAPDCTSRRRAIDYLINHFTGNAWPIITEEHNDLPHAPWWRFDAEVHNKPGFNANPSAEIIAYLLEQRVMASETPALLKEAFDYLQNNELEMHELLCYLRLQESPTLSEADKEAMLPYLLANSFRLVNVQEKDWEEYCLTPLTMITSPNSPFVDFFQDSLEANFAYRLSRQNEDGSWSPNWSWGSEYPATWKTVEAEIRVELTLAFLLQLNAFDRLS